MEKWKITANGIDCTRAFGTTYLIMNGQLLQKNNRGAGLIYDWPIHLTEKSSLSKNDIESFNEVFLSAVNISGQVIDPLIWQRTLELQAIKMCDSSDDNEDEISM